MVNLVPIAFNELPSTTNPAAKLVAGISNRYFQTPTTIGDVANAQTFAEAAAAAAASVLAMDGGPGIRVVLSAAEADAAANTAAIHAAFALAGTQYIDNGIPSTVYTITDGPVPIAPPILIPNTGNFIWQSSRGTVFRPNAINTIGFIQPADRTQQVLNIVVRDVTIDPLINPDDYEQSDRNGGFITIPGGTKPYAGSGWTGRYKNSWLENIRVEHYFDDQGFIYGVEDCQVFNPYWFNDDEITASGGHRLFEAINSVIWNACGTSPDDGQQFCPVDSTGAVYFDLICRDSYYIGGNVTSLVGRPFVIITDDNNTKNITNCGFIGVQGRGGGGQIRVLALSAGAIINPVFRDVMLSGADALLSPYGQRFEIRVTGDVRNLRMNVTEQGLQATLLQIQDHTGVVTGLTKRPSGGLIDIKADAPELDEIPDDDAVDQVFNVVELLNWDNGRIRLDIGGSQLEDAVYINDCTNLTIEVANISATPVGFAHIKQHSSTIGTRVLGGILSGDGDMFDLASVAAGDFIYSNITDGTTFIDDSPRPLASYTVAGVPSASESGAGAQIYVSDEAGGAVTAFSDGTNWRRVTDRAVIS